MKWTEQDRNCLKWKDIVQKAKTIRVVAQKKKNTTTTKKKKKNLLGIDSASNRHK
jgi:hypothetical protein